MESRQQRLSDLRRIASAGQAAVHADPGLAKTGHAGLDAALGGGLARAQLHEFFAASGRDAATTIGLGAMLALKVGGSVLWLREERIERRTRLHGPGLAGLGIDPSRILLGILPDADAVLRAAADALRCPGLGVAVIELWRNPRNLGLTATRRFQLAAEASGVTALLLRIEAEPSPSAAATRSLVRAVPGRALDANAPAFPALSLELVRHRGGGHGHWLLEWDRDAERFRDLGETPLSRALVPLSRSRAAAPRIAFQRTG